MSDDERNFDDDIAKLRDRLSSSGEDSFSDENSNADDRNYKSNDLLLKLEKALHYNELSQQMLDKLEQMFTLYLKKAKIDMERNTVLIKNVQAAKANEKLHSSRQFGIPYFKDVKNFSYPQNTDTVRRLQLNDFFFPMLHFPRAWKDSEKLELEKVIRSMEVNRQSKSLKLKILEIQAKLPKANGSELKVLGSEIDNFKHLISELLKKPLHQLIQNSKIEYDWQTISTHFHGSHTPNECRSMWFNYLHPQINRTEWLNDEDEKLEMCAADNDFQDWDTIASDLETNRSPLQCMCRYQRFLNEKIYKAAWTPQTNKLLLDVVVNLRIGDYIPFTKVAYNLPRYTTSQIINHWQAINPIYTKGKFTNEEDLFLIAAIRKYGKDFKTISYFFPRRNSAQLCNRYKALMRRKIKGQKWSTEEDKILWEKFELFGNNWSMISTFFINRSRTQVRQRYTIIRNWLKKNKFAKAGVDFPTARKMPKGDVVEEVWQKAVHCIKKDREKSETKINAVDNDLENIAFTHLRKQLDYVPSIKGRKMGNKRPCCPLEKRFNDVFRCSYAQPGGRLKTIFTEEELQHACEAMFHFQSYFSSTLNLPSVSEIETDEMLMPIDRLILKQFKYLNKPSGVCKLDLKCLPCNSSQNDNMLASEPDHFQSSDIVFNCEHNMPCIKNISHSVLPPNHTTLVGIRTYLLCRRYFSNVVGEKPEMECEETASQPLCSSDSEDGIAKWETSEQFINASNLWMKRIQSLFMWPTTIASQEPEM